MWIYCSNNLTLLHTGEYDPTFQNGTKGFQTPSRSGNIQVDPSLKEWIRDTSVASRDESPATRLNEHQNKWSPASFTEHADTPEQQIFSHIWLWHSADHTDHAKQTLLSHIVHWLSVTYHRSGQRHEVHKDMVIYPLGRQCHKSDHRDV